MAKEDLLLRTTSNPPLTTKGSAILMTEYDATLIALYNILVEQSQSSYVVAYSASVYYENVVNNYVVYSNQLWKCLSVTPIIAITPVEGVNWTAVYASDLAFKKEIYSARIEMTAADIKLAAGKLAVAAPRVEFAVEILSMAVKYTYGSAAFTSTMLYALTDTAAKQQFETASFLSGASSLFFKADQSSQTANLLAGKAVYITPNASSDVGDGTAVIYLTYRYITI